MTLTPEQKQAVSNWVTAGENLSAIQKKLAEQFKLSMTYMDVRFLVDDLNLQIKDALPKANASDVSKSPPSSAPAGKTTPAPKKVPSDGQGKALGNSETDTFPGENVADAADDDLPPEDDDTFSDELPPAGPSTLTVAVDKVTLIPGAVASGTVAFSDGVTGKWIVDNYGRPGFTEVSKPGYRPSAADAQAFMQQLSAALQKQGY